MIDGNDQETPLEEAADRTPEGEIDAEGLAAVPAPVAVFDATSAAEGEIVRGLLESEGIGAEYIPMPVYPVPLGSAVLGEAAHGIVLVAAEDEARARELIAAYSTAPTADIDEEILDAEAGEGS